MSGVITKATEWEIIPRSYANPIQWSSSPRSEVFKKRILSPEQTAQVMARLEEPNLLVCETCLDTGTRISEVTGLMIKHVVLDKGIIRIEQRHCRGDIDVPKTAKSVRGGGRGYQNGGPLFAIGSPRLSLLRDHLRTVLAVKGSLRHAQQRRALDGLRAVPKQQS